jgi:hypothetical protein
LHNEKLSTQYRRSKSERSRNTFYKFSEVQELAYLKEALKRTDEEKFLFLTNLMKMQLVMQKAKFYC